MQVYKVASNAIKRHNRLFLEPSKAIPLKAMHIYEGNITYLQFLGC